MLNARGKTRDARRETRDARRSQRRFARLLKLSVRVGRRIADYDGGDDDDWASRALSSALSHTLDETANFHIRTTIADDRNETRVFISGIHFGLSRLSVPPPPPPRQQKSEQTNRRTPART